MIKFFIELDDVPKTTAQQKRVGFNRLTGKPTFYADKKLENVIKLYKIAFSRYKPKEPILGAVRLRVEYHFKASKTNKAGYYKTTRPDTDNLQKLTKDILAKVGFFKDDALVVEESIMKCWSDKPGIYVEVEEIDKKRELIK